MKKIIKKIAAAAVTVFTMVMVAIPVMASEVAEATAEAGAISSKAIAAAICVGIAAGCGALGMGISIAKTNEAIARQPEAEGKLRTSLMLGLVFIETAIIYALIVAILVIFVL